MELMLDNANLKELNECLKIFPCSGITSNPSIIKAEGKINFINHFKSIRKLIGMDKSLHIQVISDKCEDMIKEAHYVLNHIDKNVYIKIPVTIEGLKAIKILKEEKVNITATAIYTKMQGLLAITYGADYIAPYYNRILKMGGDPVDVIAAFRKDIDDTGAKTKIVAASFHGPEQVENALKAGAQSITVQPKLLKEMTDLGFVNDAVKVFASDWENSQGTKTYLK